MMFNTLQKRLAVIAFFIGFNLVLGTYFLGIVKIGIPAPMQALFQKIGLAPIASEIFQNQQQTSLENVDLDVNKIANEINAYRQTRGVAPLRLNSELSLAANLLLRNARAVNFQNTSGAGSTEIEAALKESGYQYAWISNNSLIGPVTAKAVLESWLANNHEADLLANEEFKDLGLASDSFVDDDGRAQGVVIQLLGQPSELSSNTPALASSNQANGNMTNAKEIPDNEVIDALNAYRKTHGLYEYRINEHLCTYAEKRARDLAAHGGLDAHAGFKSDFADPENPPVGISEYPRGRQIGENLAHQFCRNMTTGDSFVAETGTALIEWCFDSSTKGHREAQLSKVFRNVCVRHADRMYVVIFGE